VDRLDCFRRNSELGGFTLYRLNVPGAAWVRTLRTADHPLRFMPQFEHTVNPV
jgi:hypothetical protein